MSGSGALRARLEAERREKLRLEQVRKECDNLANLLQTKMSKSQSDPKIASTLSGMTSMIASRISELQKNIQTAPDQTLKSLQTLTNEINTFISETVAPQKQWVKEQEEMYKDLLNFKDQVTALDLSDKDKKNGIIDRLDVLEKTIVDNTIFKETLSDIDKEITDAKEKEQQENERREIVRQIFTVLQKQGFVVKNPTLKSEGVQLIGKLPSGKGVIFHVQNNSNITFDFDGFEGTTCKTELETMLTKLSSESEVETSIEQFTWHNPDKIEKGAKESPVHPAQQRYMRK